MPFTVAKLLRFSCASFSYFFGIPPSHHWLAGTQIRDQAGPSKRFTRWYIIDIYPAPTHTGSNPPAPAAVPSRSHVLEEDLFEICKAEFPCSGQGRRPRFVTGQVGRGPALEQELDHPSPARASLNSWLPSLERMAAAKGVSLNSRPHALMSAPASRKPRATNTGTVRARDIRFGPPEHRLRALNVNGAMWGAATPPAPAPPAPPPPAPAPSAPAPRLHRAARRCPRGRSWPPTRSCRSRPGS
jgi:hypothetical protein